MSSSTQALDEFFAAQNLERLAAATGWKVERDDNVVTIAMLARDGEMYRLRLWCHDYPEQAPSAAFVDEHGSKLEPKAWPSGSGSFHEVVKPPPSSFLCFPLTREGLQHHQDWLSNPAVEPWSRERHNLWSVVNAVHRLLRSNNYAGRGQ